MVTLNGPKDRVPESGQYLWHLTFFFSFRSVSITIVGGLSCHTRRQKSTTVLASDTILLNRFANIAVCKSTLCAAELLSLTSLWSCLQMTTTGLCSCLLKGAQIVRESLSMPATLMYAICLTYITFHSFYRKYLFTTFLVDAGIQTQEKVYCHPRFFVTNLKFCVVHKKHTAGPGSVPIVVG